MRGQPSPSANDTKQSFSAGKTVNVASSAFSAPQLAMRGPPGPSGMMGRSGPLVSSLRQPKHKHTTDLIAAAFSPFAFYWEADLPIRATSFKGLGKNIHAPPAHTPRHACALLLSTSKSACEQKRSLKMRTHFTSSTQWPECNNNIWWKCTKMFLNRHTCILVNIQLQPTLLMNGVNN